MAPRPEGARHDAVLPDAQQSNFLLYAFIVAYMVGLVVVAAVAYMRKRRAIAQGSMAVKVQYGGTFSPMVLILTTFSTVFSGYTVMGVPQEAASKGYLASRWIPAIFSIVFGMLVFYPRLRRLSVERGYQSPNDFIVDRYRSKALCGLCSLCTCVPQMFYLTVQLVSFAELLSGVTLGAVSKMQGMLIFAAIVLAMEKIGGMNSVVLSDAVQATFMIFGFLALLAVLSVHYGTLPNLAAADCPTLGFVNATALDALRAARADDAVPPLCSAGSGPHADGECLPFGCIGAARPEFLRNPTHADQAAAFFLCFNFLAFPLNPHMVQRAYIARSDGAIRFVAAAVTVAAFVAMVPGVVAGITKATFASSWPLVSQGAGVSAFSAIGNELKSLGPLEYGLVAVLDCSAMAAIMSTADSVILGVSNALSVDVFEGVLCQGASQRAIVMFGTATSVAMTALSILAGMYITSADFGPLMVLQNGILLQALPAFLFGLFCEVSAQAVFCGIVVGFASFSFSWLVCNPFAALYVPHPNIGAFANFLTVLVAHRVRRNWAAPVDSGGQGKFGDRLTPAAIRGIMAGTAEPDSRCLALVGLGLLATVPFYGEVGLPEQLWAGFPAWTVIALPVWVLVAVALLAAAATWRPAAADAEGRPPAASRAACAGGGASKASEGAKEAISPAVSGGRY